MRHCKLCQGTPVEILKCAHRRPRPWWRWLQLQPSCGSPQCCGLITSSSLWLLTHWGQMMHICVGKLTIIGSDNGLSPGRCKAMIWTNDGIFLLWTLGTNFSQFVIEIQTFSLKIIRLKMASVKCCPFRLGLSVLILAGHTSCGSNVISWP